MKSFPKSACDNPLNSRVKCFSTVFSISNLPKDLYCLGVFIGSVLEIKCPSL